MGKPIRISKPMLKRQLEQAIREQGYIDFQALWSQPLTKGARSTLYHHCCFLTGKKPEEITRLSENPFLEYHELRAAT